jgi:hypothetical protein
MEGTKATFLRVRIEGNRLVGMAVTGSGTSLDATDLLVARTRSRAAGNVYGVGLQVQLGAIASVTRGAFLENRDIGISAVSPATKLDLTDVVVVDTQCQETSHKPVEPPQ